MKDEEQGGETMVFYHSIRTKKAKPREVRSRFLSPSSTPPHETSSSSHSQNPIFSPSKQKPRASTDSRNHRSLENSGFMGKLWPSSATSSSSSRVNTLADHLGNERLKDLAERKGHDKTEYPLFLDKQRSCTEFSRFDNKKENESAKENHRPVFGGSMRYTGNFKIPGRSANVSSSSSSSSSSKSSVFLADHDRDDEILIAPGRFSVDETAFRRKDFGLNSDKLLDVAQDSESDHSGAYSYLGSPAIGRSIPASYMAPTVSSRNYGIEVSSRYMQESVAKTRRWSSESASSQKPVKSDYSPKKFTLKNAMRRANSLTGYAERTLKMGLSPGRSGSPPVMGESKDRLMGLSSLKPPTSPSRVKGVGNLLTIGLDLLKGKKSSPAVLSPLGPGVVESVHQLRLLHNSLVQWRYANSRALAVNESIHRQAETKLLCARSSVIELQASVVQKQMQLQKEKLEMKLNSIVDSQIKPLEEWSEIERQHLSALSTTKDHLHSVTCRIPLTEGAKAEAQTTSNALRHASQVAGSIKQMLSTVLPGTEETVAELKELAQVVIQEKILLEECLELSKTISTLQVQERSLQCSIIQLKMLQDQDQQQKILA